MKTQETVKNLNIKLQIKEKKEWDTIKAEEQITCEELLIKLMELYKNTEKQD